MNHTLALYFDQHALLAAVCPYQGKFSLLGMGEAPRFPLYFWVDEQSVQYGESYRQAVEAGDPRAYGDVYALITQSGKGFHMYGYERDYVSLLDPILQDIQELYQARMSTLGADPEGFEAKVPVAASFADGIPAEARQRVLEYLPQLQLQPLEELRTYAFPELLIHQLLAVRALPDERLTYLVVEAFNADLNVSVLQFSPAGRVRRVKHEQFPGYGDDPRVGVLARFVLDEINRSRHLLHTDAQKLAEYRRLLPQARAWHEKLMSSQRPYVTVKAALSPMPNSPSSITIQKRQIDELTRAHSLQVARYVERSVQGICELDAVARIFVMGDTLRNSQVLQGFYRLGEEKLWVWDNEGLHEALKGMLLLSGGEAAGRIMASARPEGATPEAAASWQPVKQVHSASLEVGTSLRFTWNPDRMVKAVYRGQRQFEIVEHANSRVITGDTFVLDHIAQGKPALLENVLRKGKMLGKYRSGTIDRLEQRE